MEIKLKNGILWSGDNLEYLRTLPDNSVDSIVTDPPYGLTVNRKGGSGEKSVNTSSPQGRSRIGTGNGAGGFMGLEWDGALPSVEFWQECLRVLKPGGHVLAFASTRTQHHMAVNIENAGFEIRDMLSYVYGSGMPKSVDTGKLVDAQVLTGKSNSVAIRKTESMRPVVGEVKRLVSSERVAENKSERSDLIPANMERFHKSENKNIPVTEPVTEQGKAYKGWHSCLKPCVEPITLARKPLSGSIAQNVLTWGTGALNIGGCMVENPGESPRWPGNFMHDGSEEVVDLFPNAEASRFFYTAKPSAKERAGFNNHPTVKPLALMRTLVRLITPPGGVVLDPFAGSGTTLVAAEEEGFRWIGCEFVAAYSEIIQKRFSDENSDTPDTQQDDSPFF